MCIFLQFTHTILYEIGELRSDPHGIGIARLWLSESVTRRSPVQKRTPRFGLIGSPNARHMGGVAKSSLRAHRAIRAIWVDHARFTEGIKLHFWWPPAFNPYRLPTIGTARIASTLCLRGSRDSRSIWPL